MKNILLLSVLGLIMSGCMATHNFIDVAATPVTSSGYYTGQYNRTITTIKINQDGTGLICEDVIGTARVMSIKKSNDRLYTQDGSYWKIKSETESTLSLDYALGGGYVVQKDNDLKLASPACLEKLKK